jgi:predicted dehydrogenase
MREGRAVGDHEVEDYATGELKLAGGTTIRLACSWNLDAGQDADISALFHGTTAGAEMRNDNGSFFDFSADLLRGRERERLASPPDSWGGRAAVDWLRRLQMGERFDGTTAGLLETARALDRLYASVGQNGVERSSERPARPGERLIQPERRPRPSEIESRRAELARETENAVAPASD